MMYNTYTIDASKIKYIMSKARLTICDGWHVTYMWLTLT